VRRILAAAVGDELIDVFRASKTIACIACMEKK
jgi:hypothetical protein